MKYELVVSSDELSFKQKVQKLLDAKYELGPGFSVITGTIGVLYVREMVKHDYELKDLQDLLETQECARR